MNYLFVSIEVGYLFLGTYYPQLHGT
jgi:hypothetical protein